MLERRVLIRRRVCAYSITVSREHSCMLWVLVLGLVARIGCGSTVGHALLMSDINGLHSATPTTVSAMIEEPACTTLSVANTIYLLASFH